MAALGHAARAYDWRALATLLRAQGTHAFETTGFPFFYPPPVLLALAPLGLLSVAAGAAVWFCVSAAAWTWLARRAGLVLASALAFGPGVLTDWLHALHPAAGARAPLSGLEPCKLQNLYGLLLTLKLSKGAAMAGQLAGALAAAGWTMRLWRSDRPWTLKAAGLCAAALLASPYSAVYDLPITMVALGLLLGHARGRAVGPLEGVAMTAAYLLPMAFFATPLPYGSVVSILLCGVVEARYRDLRRADALAPVPA